MAYQTLSMCKHSRSSYGAMTHGSTLSETMQASGTVAFTSAFVVHTGGAGGGGVAGCARPFEKNHSTAKVRTWCVRICRRARNSKSKGMSLLRAPSLSKNAIVIRRDDTDEGLGG